MLRLGWLTLVVAALAVAPAASQDKNNPVVVMETSMGNIKVELFQDKAPITVANFLKYVDDKHYDGTLFHRVLDKFMIQGGGYDEKMKLKQTRPSIKNESDNNLSNIRGTIAMARTDDPDSATCQFFINVVDNSRLDRANFEDKFGYCVFGKVIEGMEAVDKIRQVKTNKKGLPDDQVVIKSVRRVEKK